MIMRFRPANISLINRRHYLPQRFEDVDRVTPYQAMAASYRLQSICRRFECGPSRFDRARIQSGGVTKFTAPD